MRGELGRARPIRGEEHAAQAVRNAVAATKAQRCFEPQGKYQIENSRRRRIGHRAQIAVAAAEDVRKKPNGRKTKQESANEGESGRLEREQQYDAEDHTQQIDGRQRPRIKPNEGIGEGYESPVEHAAPFPPLTMPTVLGETCISTGGGSPAVRLRCRFFFCTAEMGA